MVSIRMDVLDNGALCKQMDTGKPMLISVADTGVGIPPESQANIFYRFYQVDPSRRGGRNHGADLGLAIALEIVQMHGGRIGVRSRLGEGTTFDVL